MTGGETWSGRTHALEEEMLGLDGACEDAPRAGLGRRLPDG